MAIVILCNGFLLLFSFFPLAALCVEPNKSDGAEMGEDQGEIDTDDRADRNLGEEEEEEEEPSHNRRKANLGDHDNNLQHAFIFVRLLRRGLDRISEHIATHRVRRTVLSISAVLAFLGIVLMPFIPIGLDLEDTVSNVRGSWACVFLLFFSLQIGVLGEEPLLPLSINSQIPTPPEGFSRCAIPCVAEAAVPLWRLASGRVCHHWTEFHHPRRSGVGPFLRGRGEYNRCEV